MNAPRHIRRPLGFRIGTLFFGVWLSLAPLAPLPVLAEMLEYQASVTSQTVRLAPGETKSITIQFTNIGSKSWIGSQANTALYLYGDASIFKTSTWLKNDLPVVVTPAIIKSGQVATATFTVKAPQQVGTYRERFLLSNGKNSWMKGSVVPVTFEVVGTSSSSATPAASAVATAAQSDSTEWRAELVDKGGMEWQVEPGGHLMMKVAFKNRGTKSWVNEGGLPLWMLTASKHASAFKDFSWLNNIQVAKLKETTVRPGDVGHFTVELRAPAIPGTYTEVLQLSAGANGEQWLANGSVSFPIRVTLPNEYITKGVPAGESNGSGAYAALLMLKPSVSTSLVGNGRVQLTYGFKNIGTQTWNSMSLQVSGVRSALTGTVASVRDESWPSVSEPVRATGVTAPGQIGFVTFTLKAPARSGSYTAAFSLYANTQKVESGEIEIPITVTADGAVLPEPAVPVVAAGPVLRALNGDLSTLPAEPMIRVGLFATTDNQMIVRAVSGGFTLQESNNVLCTFTSGQSVHVSFDRATKLSKASGPGCTTQSSGVYVAVPDDPIGPLEMTDFSRPVSWLPGANDNKFRGKLELRYTPKTDSVWVINEVPVEWYLKGSGETSNSSPPEYQKALLTAARTYAMYHIQRGTKHANENYIVDATYDQVYRGYGAEIRNPVVVKAIDDTRGQIVTYDGKLAITPYYSRSDGRTRAWSEVWGGSYPWLVSVPSPWDVGRVLWGHGVGMSATGAIGAANDGWMYDRILKHFYTGIELMMAYR